MMFPHDMPKEEMHRKMEEIREEQRKNIHEWCKKNNTYRIEMELIK